MRAARASGSVKITWDPKHGEEGFIHRVDLEDNSALAAFLGLTPRAEILSTAMKQLDPLRKQFSVITDVLDRWSHLKRVRGCGPEDVQKWIDAATVIEHARVKVPMEAVSVPVREMSSRLFKDSKRIEKLTAPLDVLLSDSLESEVRTAVAIWSELGLFREEIPALMAGNITAERDRLTAFLDTPYVGLHSGSIKRLMDIPRHIMSIENLTTFHSEARKHCNEPVLLLYTNGMPSPAWRLMYLRILKDIPTDVPVYHWGDVDEGGFRIAARLAQDALTVGHIIKPWRMHPSEIPVELRCKTTKYVLNRIRYYADAAGWPELGKAVEEAGFTVEQEGLG